MEGGLKIYEGIKKKNQLYTKNPTNAHKIGLELVIKRTQNKL